MLSPRKHTHQIVRKVFGSSLRLMIALIVALAVTALLFAGVWNLKSSAAKAVFFATRLVAPGGADSGDCTGSPCATINYAIGQALAGDTISVAAGTYTENVTITKSLIMNGAQAGVDARGRVAGESIIMPAVATTATFNVAFNGAITIDGFTFSGGSAGTQGCIFTSVGPNNNMQIVNNRFSGYSTAAIWMNRGGSDITIDKNVLDGSNLVPGSTNQAIFANGPQSYTGLYITNNNIINNANRYGFFVDGNHNVTESATRAPSISGNRFDNNLQGMNLGSRSFGVLGTPALPGAAYGGFITNNTFSNHAFDGFQAGIQHVLVSGNTFSNNGRNGLALTSFGNTGADRGGQNSAIKGNLFTGNGSGANGPGAGIFFSGTQGVGLIETNHANFNRIVGNNIGIQYGSSVATGNNATIDVENNWWGCNFGPAATGAGCTGTTNGTLVFAGNSGVLDANPWLTLTPMAMPSPVPAGTTSTLSAKLVINSDSVDTTAGAMFVPNGTPATFAQGTRGSVAPTGSTTTNGAANTTYTSNGTLGSDSVSMTIDGQTVLQALNVVVGPAAKLVFVQQPTNTPPSFTTAPAVTVQMQDAGGNNVAQSGISVTMALSTGTGTLSGTLTQTTDASGLATYNNLSINQPGSKQLTASSGGLTPAVSNTFNILPVPLIVYVDDNWVGTPMGADPDGAGPATVFGYDAFATVQGGINGVASSGQVIVYAGTYIENPNANKAVNLTGANAGVAGSASRVAESIIRTNGAAQNAVVTVSSNNVTVNGFTLDGDDPGFAGTALGSGEDTNCSYGVRPTSAYNNIAVSNNIIKRVAIGFRGDGAAQNNFITANLFDSIGFFDFGYAVSLRTNYYAEVTNNKMTRVWTGLHTNNFSAAGGPAVWMLSGNEIHSYAAGLAYWLQYQSATALTVSNNQFIAEMGAANNNFGILMVSIQDTLNPSFTGNTIAGHDHGVGMTNTSTSNVITLDSTNMITGTKKAGVYLTDNLTFNPVGTSILTSDAYTGPTNAIAMKLNGVSIGAAAGVGVKVETSRAANDVTTTANIMAGTSISGGVTGLLVTGASTALAGNTLNNASFTGQTGNYVTLASSALDNLEINATAVSFDGLTGATATQAQNFAIEDKLVHAVDDSSLGLLRVKINNLFVTAATPSPGIQRAVDVANPSETVNVGPGTFLEDVGITKTLIVSGSGPASTTVSGPIGGPGSTFFITANSVELKNFKITREGNNTTDWNNPNTNTAGISIAGNSLTGANIHDNLVTQNRTGIDINNCSGHTVRNNIITDNNTGMIFRNVTDNMTVVENEITLNRTVGIVFLNANTEPVQSALNCTFSNNNLSGNWYAQIVDRQTGTTAGNPIPTPGTTNLKNFSGNWFGTNLPVITTANSAEPGYAAHIPVEFGGTAVPPGGQPDIAGPASANFDYTPYLDAGSDTNVETTPGRGTYGFQGSANVLDVIATNAQTSATGRIQEGVNLVSGGGTVKALAGTYTESANVNKAAMLAGTPTINGTLNASAAGATISPGFSPGIINTGDLTLTAGSALNIELASAAGPGTGHDQVNVTNAVSLGGATLNVTLSFMPAGGTSFTIINNNSGNPVSGVFNGLPEGTVFLVSGVPLKISYVGNTGNDVVLTVACPAITLTPALLPGGVAGVPYSQAISAAPTGGNYTFSHAGTLPPGLALAPNGTLAGMPTTNGSYTFTVTATGFAPFACTGSPAFTVVIGCPAITLTPASLPNGTAGVAYNQTLSATPAGGNYTFALTNGTLPNGVTLASNGTLAGTPTQGGTFNFRVTASGFGGCTNFRDYQLTINCTTISLTPASLPGGTVGTAYSQTVTASPSGAYSYTVTSGVLPPGLTLNAATGEITGTPATTGTFAFTISAAAGACVGSRGYSVSVACASISFTTTSLPAGNAGVPYSQPLAVTPAGSYAFSLVTGNLPAGLTLNTSTGVISGMPSVKGTTTFTLKVQTANGCSATQSFTLVINCPTVSLSPGSLSNGTVGVAYSQAFTATPAGGGYSYAAGGALPPGLNLNPATGVLSGTPTANGTFTFTVTAIGFGGCTGSLSYTIVVSGGGGCPAITLPANLPNGSVGALYSSAITASPIGIYTYAVTAGSLPTGLALYGNFGLIFGYPLAVSNSTFTIQATDANNCTASKQYTINISLGFLPSSLPDATAGVNYNQRFTALGASGAAAFQLASGSLPQGLSLAQDGKLAGTPSEKGRFPLQLKVTDQRGNTGTQEMVLKVNDVDAPAVTGSISDPLNCRSGGSTVNVSATVTNSSAATQTANFAASLPAQLLALPGTCVASIGTCSVVSAASVTWSGALTAGQSVTITYQAQIADGTPAGAQVCLTSTASFVGGGSANVTACTTLNCPAAGPGLPLATSSPINDQKAGSVLIYNIYTSSSDPIRQNTRINLTNTDPTRQAFVHLFFVDGTSCTVADSFLCLTPNQTTSFLASDLDPGTTGYLVAVATDAAGCPINFNFLIGDEYVKFQSGHAANLGAEAITAIAGGLPFCNTNSSTATLAFDGISYDVVGHVLAADNVPSRADGNDTLLIVNRIGGNLGTGAGTLGTIFGLFFDDTERSLSFQFTPGTCQFRSSISNNFPRIAPRFEQFIPAGHSGWFKLWWPGLFGITGSVINFNANTASSAGAFSQGHNLHKLTLTNTASYTIPVFPPSC